MVSQLPTPPPTEGTSWLHVPQRGATPAHFVFPKPVQKSDQDECEYKVIKLENGLQAMLIHDAKTDKAAASLDVAVGHLNDPDDMPGLAHFCEHLLFMGTEQFPKENEYSEFLSKNGGSSNAFTAASNTNYYFKVGVKAFPGALERFSGFFHSPLFSPSCTVRELNAVDSENKKNLQSDMWRIFQLNKHLTKPGHPWSKFGSGNKQSLTAVGRSIKAKDGLYETRSGLKRESTSSLQQPSPIPSRVASPAPSTLSTNSDSETDGGVVGRETRRRLVEWWGQEYCASRMGLTLLGRESLEELTELATKLFSPIPNRGHDSLPIVPDHPFGPNEMGTIVSVKTIMDFHAFELSFPLPYQAPLWRSKPGSFLAHFVGHEGPGSLHSYLKSKGWITSLSAGCQSLGRCFAMFKATIHLTKDGFLNYRSALLACYKYLSLLRSSEFPPWYHREIQLINATRFRFAEKQRPDSYSQWISEHLLRPLPRELLLAGPQLVWDWDEQLVRSVLDTFTVDQGRVVVMAKDHGDFVKEWSKEPWYGTEYKVHKIDEEFAALARGPNDIPELYLPDPNEFIPTRLDVDKREVSQPLKRPILLRQTPLSSLWHKKDDQFWLPKAQVMMEIRSPLANSSAREAVMTRLYTDLVNDALNEFAYDADLAGLRYGFGPYSMGMYVSLSGYNDKLHVLARDVLEKVKNLQVKPQRLAVMKEQAKLEWENFFLGQSYQLSDYFGHYLFTAQQWTLPEKLAEVSTITAEELNAHVVKLLSRVDMNVLVTGNLTKDDAIRITETTERILAPEALLPDEKPTELALILPESCNYVWQTNVPNPNEVNSSITYYSHVGDVVNPRLRATFGLLAQIIHEPAFNVLRTKEQLGYIVFSSTWQATGSIGLRILVQSEKDPQYLETRVDAFLTSMRDILESMDEKEFEEQRKGLIHKWTEKLKNLTEETDRFWNHIESGYLDFFRREKDSVILQTITREEVIGLYSKFIDPASPTRSKLSVHLQPQKKAPRKFSVPASQAFLSLLRSNNVPVNEEEYVELSSREPPIVAVKKHWEQVLHSGEISVDASVSETLLHAIDDLGKQYPAVGEGEVKLREGTTYIRDPKNFKASLKVSEHPKPVEIFYDLPVSKF
ncbi:insulin-degrading enzyme [Rickenella mellea]|uniref:Insulin-degrading enzyme n=1 Tax=Rickenella mellea TaxID=50990 RepID=A0A4Y7QDH7_9AGAM|nr:insulin-degrading enzyme [Rickenella mellea]